MARPKKVESALESLKGTPLFSDKYSKTVCDFICSKIEDGLTIKEITDKYSENGLIAEKTVYRWKKKYPEFREAIAVAYQTFFCCKLEELEVLSKTDVDPNMSASERNSALQQKKIRVDALKFMLSKIAPKMCPELQDRPANTVSVMPTINLIHYGDRT